MESDIKKSLIGKKFDVLDKGHVILMDCMGDDHDIAQAARTSYGKGTRSVSGDRTLLRYLMRHRHTSPFEQAELKFHKRLPMDSMRQLVRHRTASLNEYSTRYSEAIDDRQGTPPGEWRLQSSSNKQGSGGYLEEWPEGTKISVDEAGTSTVSVPGRLSKVIWDAEVAGHFGPLTPGAYLSYEEEITNDVVRQVYEQRLKFGVAREQARKDLPLSTYTEAVWKIDLHNLLHFLSLRMDSHAQHEIRQYANVIGHEIVAKLFPITWEAFLDYRVNSITFSGTEILVLSQTGMGASPGFLEVARSQIGNARELREFLEKVELVTGKKIQETT